MLKEYPVSGQPQQADGAAAQPDLQSSTANLTQELSLLLAQSIAQGQSGKRTPGATAAGSEFANLAALISASQGQAQRSHQPSFKDGLSSLSYARPAQQPIPPPPPAPVLTPPSASLMAPPPGSLMSPSAGSLLVADQHDEEPMPIPSTWRQPTPGDDDRWYRQQLGAAGLGLIAGLVVVVPAVLWLSFGWVGGSHSKPAAATRAASPDAPVVPPVKVAEVKPVKIQIASATTAAAEPRYAPAPEPTEQAENPYSPKTRAIAVEQPVVTAAAPYVPPRPVEPVRSRADELLGQAKRRIDSGDIAGARDILQASETSNSGAMTFLLAETYDPNMLASWQTRGITANPEKARFLYQRARELGEPRAQQRIEWLSAN